MAHVQQPASHSGNDRDSLPQSAVQRVEAVAEAKKTAAVTSLFEHQRFHEQEQLDPAQEPAPVEQALSLFDQLSSQLTSSYRTLEQKVSQLRHDLSEEELQREAQFKEKEALATRLSTLLEILPAGVVLLDDKGRVSECNPAAIDLLGEPLEGQLWLDVIKRCFSPKHDDGHEVSLKDGRRVRIETRSMTSGTGQLILLSDLTETRLLQEQVSRAERLSSLGKMVASLAHQIRTPLSTAMLYAGHLCQPGISDGMRVDCAEKLLARLTHLEHQIRDMLIFAKGETRLAEQLSAGEFLESLRHAAEPVLAKAGVRCNWRNAASDRVILCNKEALIGAILNLINNSIEAGEALKHTDRELRLSIGLCSRADNTISINVRDNGPGIPEDKQDQVFEPFFTTKPQGTGLGLAVVQAVVKAHHGVFKVDSSDQGVVTVITLPAYEIKQSRNKSNNSDAKRKQKSPQE
ncbi:MAG: ATP-binding protein [Oleiphilaceae bacterium]|nr:ATP-binding protein [Oleiphilaceae bacterium]